MPKIRRSPKCSSDDGDGKKSVFERLGSKSKQRSSLLTLKGSRKLTLERIIPKTDTMKKSRHTKKKDKHRRSNKATSPQEHPDIQDLDAGELEGADEKFLQKRRLELQRELRLQLKKEKKLGNKKSKKAVVPSSDSSESSSESSSSSTSSSSSSSYAPKKGASRKREASSSSDSAASPPPKKKRSPTPPPVKIKVEAKKKEQSPSREPPKRSTAPKRSVSPRKWDSKSTPTKKRSPRRSKSRHRSPKQKQREPSPRRAPKQSVKSVSRRPSPPRPRSRSPERRSRPESRPSPVRSRPGGLEKGGKILPVKLSAYAKEVKSSSSQRRSPSRSREEREREMERQREKKRREERQREAERREREAERIKREVERQKEREREEALQRSKERERQREKREKEYERSEMRKTEVKSDLPSLLDIRTEAPVRETARGRGWEEKRPRRSDEGFDYRRGRADDSIDKRKGRKPEDYSREPPPSSWDGRPVSPEKWPRESRDQRPPDPKWTGGRRDHPRERDHFGGRRSPPEWRMDKPVGPNSDVRNPQEPSCAPPADVSADHEDLSDISDGPDEILNQDEAPETFTAAAVPPPSLQLPPAATISQSNSDFFFDSRRPLLECLGDRGLDFEEISDEELEEEAKIGKGIMDYLEADWASLMGERVKKAPVVEEASSARRRWRADAIIARVGFSRALAGDSFAEAFLAKIREPSPGDAAASEENTKKSDGLEEENTDPTMNGEDAVKASKEINVELLDPLPGVHSMKAALSHPCPIQRLLNPIAKQALSARTDLAIRRVMCNLSANEPSLVGPCEGPLKLAVV